MTNTFYQGKSIIQTGEREFEIIPVSTPFRRAYDHKHQTIKLTDKMLQYSCEQTVETFYDGVPTGPIKHLDRFSTSKPSISLRISRIDWRTNEKGEDYPDILLQKDTRLMYYDFGIMTRGNDVAFTIRDMKDAQFLFDAINKWIENDV